jgi:hypothetical protein
MTDIFEALIERKDRSWEGANDDENGVVERKQASLQWSVSFFATC